MVQGCCLSVDNSVVPIFKGRYERGEVMLVTKPRHNL